MLAVAGVLAGCSSAPPVRLHTLQAQPGDAAAVTTAATTNGTAEPTRQPIWITLAPVRIPPAVDRPQWLVDEPDGTLRLLEQDRWASPLSNEVQAALLDGLRQRYGAVQAQREDAPGASAVWRVVVDIERLEAAPGVEARLDAVWSVSTGAEPHGGSTQRGVTCRSVLRQAAGIDTGSLAAAHRRNVQALADAIGQTLADAVAEHQLTCPTRAAPPY